MRVIVLLLFCASSAWAQSLTIDDFSTGSYQARLMRPDTKTDIQCGSSIIGGCRQTTFQIQRNDYDQPNTFEIRGPGVLAPRQHELIVATGPGAYHSVNLFYGIDKAGNLAPLNLNLLGAGYDRFVVNIGNTNVLLNFTMQVWTSGSYSQLSYNVFHSGVMPFPYSFRFSDFVHDPSFPGADFSNIEYIFIVVQTATLGGGGDYVFTSIVASAGTSAAAQAGPVDNEAGGVQLAAAGDRRSPPSRGDRAEQAGKDGAVLVRQLRFKPC
jgi:hypothetical protein